MKRALKDSISDRFKNVIVPQEELRNFNTRLPSEFIYELKVYCIKNRVPIQEFVKNALIDRMERGKK